MFDRTHLGILDPPERTQAFLRVYEAYIVPVHMTPEQLSRHITMNDVRLDESPLWLDASRDAVALGLLGVREARGWIGGFGVAQPHRGKGLARGLAREMLERAARLGVREVQLEVITTNEYAIRTYLRAGFVKRRDLRVLIRPPDAPAPAHAGEAVEADPDVLLRAGLLADAEPCWQREPRTLLDRGGIAALVAGRIDEARGFALFATGPTGVRIGEVRVADTAAAADLVAALAARFPDQPFTVLNEPEDSRTGAALEALGFTERLRQHEMVART